MAYPGFFLGRGCSNTRLVLDFQKSRTRVRDQTPRGVLDAPVFMIFSNFSGPKKLRNSRTPFIYSYTSVPEKLRFPIDSAKNGVIGHPTIKTNKNYYCITLSILALFVKSTQF